MLHVHRLVLFLTRATSTSTRNQNKPRIPVRAQSPFPSLSSVTSFPSFRLLPFFDLGLCTSGIPLIATTHNEGHQQPTANEQTNEQTNKRTKERTNERTTERTNGEFGDTLSLTAHSLTHSLTHLLIAHWVAVSHSPSHWRWLTMTD